MDSIIWDAEARLILCQPVFRHSLPNDPLEAETSTRCAKGMDLFGIYAENCYRGAPGILHTRAKRELETMIKAAGPSLESPTSDVLIAISPSRVARSYSQLILLP